MAICTHSFPFHWWSFKPIHFTVSKLSFGLTVFVTIFVFHLLTQECKFYLKWVQANYLILRQLWYLGLLSELIFLWLWISWDIFTWVFLRTHPLSYHLSEHFLPSLSSLDSTSYRWHLAPLVRCLYFYW